MYHWLFVPLTIGLSLIVAVMESVYVRTGDSKWKSITKFWMTLFGINFACGVATGIILEFEFGTNWSNYSWFVGDIFGAPRQACAYRPTGYSLPMHGCNILWGWSLTRRRCAMS